MAPTGKETEAYQSIFSRFDQIISHLSDNVSAETLADKLYTAHLITPDSLREACHTGERNSNKMRKLLLAVLSRIELDANNYNRFMAILTELGVQQCMVCGSSKVSFLYLTNN